jgi:hypothetical protein
MRPTQARIPRSRRSMASRLGTRRRRSHVPSPTGGAIRTRRAPLRGRSLPARAIRVIRAQAPFAPRSIRATSITADAIRTPRARARTQAQTRAPAIRATPATGRRAPASGHARPTTADARPRRNARPRKPARRARATRGTRGTAPSARPWIHAPLATAGATVTRAAPAPALGPIRVGATPATRVTVKPARRSIAAA